MFEVPVADPDAHDRVMARVHALGLTRHVGDLETDGLTVVPPERIGAPTDRLLERVLDLMEDRNGVRPDLESGETHRDVAYPTLYYFLLADDVFVDWLLHPVLLALVEYLLGEQCVLHATTVFMKGPTDRAGGLQLGLHTDQQMFPSPFPTYACIAGATLLLSDYSHEGGAFAYVPGSHARARHPVGREGSDRAVPVEAPAGSLLVHHGALWHGSFPRRVPGLRIGMAYAFSRMFVTPLEAYREHATKELLARRPARLARLLGQHVPAGSTEAGHDLEKVYFATARTRWD